MSEQAVIPAATLVVIRDRPSGPPDLLIVERAQGMAFAGGALVFPGGRIDEADVAMGGDCAAQVAAIRETIEETAIPVGITPLPPPDVARSIQQRLLEGVKFDDLLEAHGLALSTGALTPFARWVPKFHAARRFDTMFFIARAAADDWEPNVIAGECSDAFWIDAQGALDRERNGDAQLIFPTRRNLERLALHRDFEAIRADAEGHAVQAVTPWVEQVDGESFITIPDGIGYPVTREKLDGLWRG